MDPAAVAVRAFEVHEQHCGEAKRDNLKVAGSSIAEVGQALSIVDDAVAQTGDVTLLYWRALLADCVGRSDTTRTDLQAFLSATEGEAGQASLRQDAKRRLDRLGGSGPGRDPRIGPALGLGIAFGSAAGVLAGLSGWQYSELEQARAQWIDPELQRGDFAGVQADGEAAASGTNAFISLAAGLAITAVVAPIVAATSKGSAPGRAALVVLPTPGGLSVVGALSW